MLNKGTETDRLVLRILKKTDIADMYEYTSCNDTCKFLKWGPHIDITETEQFIGTATNNREPKDILWGIELKINKKLIGVIRIYDINFLKGEGSISYILNKKFIKQGYMTEAVTEVINICFKKLKLARIYAYFAEGNIASETVMIRSGMVKTSKVHQEEIKSKMYNIFEYVIFKDNIEMEKL